MISLNTEKKQQNGLGNGSFELFVSKNQTN